MRRGKINHKGRARKFTSPEELEQERRAEQAKQWREKNKPEGEDAEGSSEEAKSGSGSDSDSESDSDADKSKKGAQGTSMIDVENPNRIVQKTKKVAELEIVPEATGKPQLSRREREEVDKQRAKEHYQKLHAAGKTDEARADLARLAIIKKQREDAAKKREDDRLQKEADKAAKSASISKALGKKT